MMPTYDIKISVVMPAYNAEGFIAEAIASVLAQTFTDFELIIVNDGSTDNTATIIQSFDDPRIVVIHQPNQGVAAALNTGLQYAKADYIARFDADDVCYPTRLQKQYAFMQQYQEYNIVGSAVNYMEQDGSYVFTYYPAATTDPEIQSVKHHTCPFIHSSVLYHRKAILQQGGYNTGAHSFEDHLLWMHVLHEGRGYNIQEPLIKVRLNPQSVTIDEKWRTKAFHRIKHRALQNGHLTASEAKQLEHILTKQNNQQVKQGAYHALLAKKYLWNNYKPEKAREHLREVLRLNKWNGNSCLLYLLSFLPERLLRKTYKRMKTKETKYKQLIYQP